MPGKNWHEAGPDSVPAVCGTNGGGVSPRLNRSAKRRVGEWWTAILYHSPPTTEHSPKYWLLSNRGAKDFASAGRGLNQRPGRSSGEADIVAGGRATGPGWRRNDATPRRRRF